MDTSLPDRLRPRGIPHRPLRPGIDVPTWFIEGLKGMDPKLHLVWHPWRIMYDQIMNQYEGDPDDPRFTITEFAGEETWGFPLTNEKGEPIPERRWHVWRLCDPYGWAHVCDIKSEKRDYLRILLNRLHWQALLSNATGGRKAMLREMQEMQETKMVNEQNKAQELWSAVQEENSWLMREAMDNMGRGKVAPTNPQKESIFSFPGQKSHSRIIRPLDDEEGGLIIPEKW